MGPRSDNRGYVGRPFRFGMIYLELQWVHGRITVVMDLLLALGADKPRTSMGPRSDNRGYGLRRRGALARGETSMGPRSDNRGYVACGLA